MHSHEMRVRDLERDIVELKNQLIEIDAWRRLDETRSYWFYSNEPIIKEVVDNAKSLRRVRSWLIGLASLLGGIMMIWGVIWPLIRDHQR
ncbi:MAG: hypothetical protein EOM24_02960 [Chloroflexia bacterium]|nr:hypothetical protein [Chloroflexia bacterium]